MTRDDHCGWCLIHLIPTAVIGSLVYLITAGNSYNDLHYATCRCGPSWQRWDAHTTLAKRCTCFSDASPSISLCQDWYRTDTCICHLDLFDLTFGCQSLDNFTEVFHLRHVDLSAERKYVQCFYISIYAKKRLDLTNVSYCDLALLCLPCTIFYIFRTLWQ